MILSKRYVGMGVAAFVVSMSAGFARGQSAVTEVRPEVKVRKHVVRAEKSDRDQDTSSREQQSINVVNDDDEISIQIEDGKVISATRNGKAVPLDQIKRDGGRLQILGKGGTIEFETDVDHAGAHAVVGKQGKVKAWWDTAPGKHGGMTYSLSTPQGMSGGPGPGTWEKYVDLQPAGPDGEQPKVMIGVQLAEPDRSLLGHFGLKPGETTMVSGVYKGMPAADAGIKPYDIIVAVNGDEKSAAEGSIRKALREKREGDTVTITVIHEGKRRDVRVRLAPFDQDRLQKAELDSVAEKMDLMTGYASPKQFATLDLDDLKTKIHSLAELKGLSKEDTERVHKEIGKAMEQAEKAQKDAISALKQTDKARLESDKARREAETAEKSAVQRFRVFRGDAAKAEAGDDAGRMKGIEERLDHLEKMLQKIIEKQDSQGRNRRAPAGGAGGERAPEGAGNES